MEKKNMVLLTIIAVATLLVAVVGATFAYFTATVTETGADENRTTTVTTETMVNAVMDLGSAVTATDVYPGHKEVKTVHVTGSGSAGAVPVNARITVNANIPTQFGSDVTWTLYEVDGAPSVTACTNTKHDDVAGTERHYYETVADCGVGNATSVSGATAVSGMTSSSTGTLTKDIQVTYDFNKTYILVVNYANNESATQNSTENEGTLNASGQTYTVSISFAPTPAPAS